MADPRLTSLVGKARSLGLRVDNSVVLRDGANFVVHLAPSPVVARMATLTAEMRQNPADYLRRERDITDALRAAGAVVVGPTGDVDPGPHEVDGRVFLLLEHQTLTPVDQQSPAHAEMVGRSLAELVQMLRALPAEMATGNPGHPWPEIARLREISEARTDPAALEVIDAVLAELQATEPDVPVQIVHGDSHPNNVALHKGEVMWFDFEDANLRPLAWDLMTMRRSWPAAGDAAFAALNLDPESPTMAWHHELRDLYALLWNRLYIQRFDGHETAASERLAAWLSTHAK